VAAHGAGVADVTHRAYGFIYGSVLRQATTLAYIDTLWFLAVASGVMTLLVLFLRRSKPGASMAH